MLVLGFFLLNGALVVGSQPKGVGTPENITVHVIDSKTAEVFWSTAWKNVERYDITYNPTENRVVSQAAGNSHSIVLRELRPNTQYQVTVTAVIEGKNYKSRRLVFRTSADQNDFEEIKPIPTKPSKSKKSHSITQEIINPDPTAIGSKYTPQTSTTVRGVEIGLVLLALVVWIIAIALFFHRWGKIRMLLPYQPDYKTQQSLKVPGTGTTIVSGCTGNTSSQGQQEGPGCVQHLRWSTRFFDEPPTAKKHSPTIRPLKPRVSSAIFPASPSFCYARTSAECDSPRIIRHAHSQGEFPAESIPLCQVDQPRSENPQNVISITVPVMANNVNEKVQNNKNGRLKAKEHKNLCDNIIMKFDGSEFSKRNKNDTIFQSSVDKKHPPNIFHSYNFYANAQDTNIRERSERHKENFQSPPELETLFIIEPSDNRFHESPTKEVKPPQESEKPKRYDKSSLKKQKVRLHDDRELIPCKNVPIYECERNSQEQNQKPQEIENEKNRKPKNLKTQELRRKTFLRKVSLQDTYLNYNQDYWLDFKNSGRFHRSIDLGYFGNEDVSNNKTEMQSLKKMPNVEETSSSWKKQFIHRIATINQTQPIAIKTQSKLSSKSTFEESLKKSDSDPVIFPSMCSCENCQINDVDKGGNDSNELLIEIITKNKRKETGVKTSWLFLPSNENIPLFYERNGLIETDFDLLNEDCLLYENFQKDENKVFCSKETRSSELESKANDLGALMDFSNFYEVKLAQSSESENSNFFSIGGGETFFEKFASTSGDSDVSCNETDSPRRIECGSPDFSYLFRSSSSPPKSSSN